MQKVDTTQLRRLHQAAMQEDSTPEDLRRSMNTAYLALPALLDELDSALAEAGRLRAAAEEVVPVLCYSGWPDGIKAALASTPTTAAWLEARDRRNRLIGAAEELEVIAGEWSKRGRERRFLAQDLTERAAQLRREAEK